MKFIWDEEKSRQNELHPKRGFGFEFAAMVFNDPLRRTRDDLYPHEDRWQTIGMIGALCIIVVWTLRTDPDNPTDPLTRIISARRAEKAERKIYENGNFEGGL
jgi:uncharacterized DUF497 family protein